MNKPHRKSASVFRITAHVHASTRREKSTTFIENVALTIEQTIVDSNHLLTHANAVGCTLERRESSTFGRSLISPLLCQGNRERARKHQSAHVRAASCTHRQWNMLPANVQKQTRNRCGESYCPRRVRAREREKCGETTEELRRLVNARAPRRAHPLYFRLRSKLKRRTESRVFYVLNSLRAALQRRLSIQKINNKNFVETNRRFKVDAGVGAQSQRSSPQSKDGEYYVLFLHSVQLLWTRLHPRRRTSRRARARRRRLETSASRLVSPKESAECETE